MSDHATDSGSVANWLRKLLSLPVAVKITGVGALVGLLFATIVGYQVQKRMATSLYRELTSTASTSARLLGESLARPMVLNDLVSVRQVIRRAASTIPGVSYILVEDHAGKVVAHSFDGPMPEEIEAHEFRAQGNALLQALEINGDNVMDASAPIVGGKAGHIHVGLSDRPVKLALADVEEAIIITLVTCMVLGQLLALVLAFVLTLPISRLVDVSHQLGRGRFSVRARVVADDEVGQLAMAFNDMATGLEDYQREIEEKEAQQRRLLGRIVSAQEDERRRLALELHDELGQSLSSLLLNVRECRNSAQQTTPIDRLESNIQTLIGDVRRLAFLLRPAILDDYGLDAALRRYAEELDGQASLKVDYQGNLTKYPRLPNEVESALYRIVQESCTNVFKHAQATRASIVLVRTESQVSLLVEDNGIGMDADAALRAHAGVGLAGMKERVTLLGGEFMLESTRTQGTLVRAVIPLEV